MDRHIKLETLMIQDLGLIEKSTKNKLPLRKAEAVTVTGLLAQSESAADMSNTREGQKEAVASKPVASLLLNRHSTLGCNLHASQKGIQYSHIF